MRKVEIPPWSSFARLWWWKPFQPNKIPFPLPQSLPDGVLNLMSLYPKAYQEDSISFDVCRWQKKEKEICLPPLLLRQSDQKNQICKRGHIELVDDQIFKNTHSMDVKKNTLQKEGKGWCEACWIVYTFVFLFISLQYKNTHHKNIIK